MKLKQQDRLIRDIDTDVVVADCRTGSMSRKEHMANANEIVAAVNGDDDISELRMSAEADAVPVSFVVLLLSKMAEALKAERENFVPMFGEPPIAQLDGFDIAVRTMALVMKQEDPRFDAQKFYATVGMEG